VRLRVVTALGHRWEAGFATALEESGTLTLVRRCADLADLLAAASAGLADIAVVSPDVRWLDRDALRHLAAHGVRVAGAVSPEDDAGERRLRQLGVTTTMTATATTEEIEKTLADVSTLNEAGLAGPAGPEARDGAPPRPGAHGPEEPGRIIAVWGPIGSPGRTTLAVGIASECAAAGLVTLLADADTYGASIAQTLALVDEAPGMAAAARSSEQGTLDLPMLARLAPEVSPGLRVLTGIPRAERWPELRAAALEHVLQLGRLLATCVVVDCGFSIEEDEELSYDTLAPRRNGATLAVLAQADELVVVGSADPIGLQRLVRAVQDLGMVPSPRPRVVVNKVRVGAVGPRPERAIREALARFAGMDDLAFVPFDHETLDSAMLAGRTLLEHAPNSAVRGAIAAVARACALKGSAGAPRSRRQRTLLRR
jgi:MinD-like ATPase involved in chromosome partitioning or flagellar assembly